MRLTKLEMSGFKSFAKKTEIDFRSGITAVIGPNGSGKSNIADAVRWVLGEQSARVLRGSKMEDVIFNGTETRKPMAFCEVTLTFDNTDGQLAVDFSEVSVTRRVYRSGESEYYINRNACRLKDIHELFRDTGIGKEGYSIIGQGKVEEILSNKTDDRRNAFEEAAGVMKYRVRKEESERKLDNTRKNLERLTDILDELDKQVGPLEEQSRTAREYLKLRDELKDIEINVFLYQYDKWNERLKDLEDTMKQLDSSLAASVLTETALAETCAFEEENERALSATISNLQNRLLALTTGVQSSSGESNVIRERMENLIAERERLTAQIRDNEKRLDELTREMDEAKRKHAKNSDAYSVSEEELENAEAELKAGEAEIAELEDKLEEQKNSVIEAMNRLADTRSLLSGLEGIRATLNDRLSALSGDEAELKREGERLQREFAGADGLLQGIQQRCDAAVKARQSAIEEYNELNQRLTETRALVRQMEQTEGSSKARIKVLEEMKRAHEGYYTSVRSVLKEAERNIELKKCIEGVVAELIRVPMEYETAVEMALGSALQNIVTPTDNDAKRVIEVLREKQFGRATLLPVSAMRPRLLTAQELNNCRVDGFIGVASELVGFDERYRGVMENLLGRTVIVKDLDAGIAINRRSSSQFRIATLKGDIINPGGSMTGGSVQKREFSLIGREREIEELNTALKKLAADLQEKERDEKELEAGLTSKKADVDARGEAVHEINVELATEREKVDIITKYVDKNKEALERVELERSQIRDNLDDIASQGAQAERDREDIESGNIVTQDDIRKTQHTLAGKRTDHSEAGALLTERKVALMALTKERTAAENEIKRMEREAEQLKKAVDSDRRAVDGFAERFATMQEEMKALGVNIEAGQKDIDGLTDQIAQMNEECTSHQKALDDARERRDTVAIELSDLKERRHRAELNESKTRQDLSNMVARIWEEYELTYENAQPMRRDIAITATNVRVGELRRDIKELGDVNVSSIEDYRAVKDRFESLSAQCDDLNKAERDLQELISELVATMETEFKTQFELIQQNFTVVFSELFGGGHAELVLGDANDILNCDIDIIAQPPGKRLQLLSLLSGGERALTAIALLFSILKLKPTAFCILDEIESSLDEVNVSNFAEYVRNYSDDTQFIIITHRKGSMEVCDSLYGVAMEEKGVSKVVSAKFTEIA